jgi:hypothetical protein
MIDVLPWNVLNFYKYHVRVRDARSSFGGQLSLKLEHETKRGLR